MDVDDVNVSFVLDFKNSSMVGTFHVFYSHFMTDTYEHIHA